MIKFSCDEMFDILDLFSCFPIEINREKVYKNLIKQGFAKPIPKNGRIKSFEEIDKDLFDQLNVKDYNEAKSFIEENENKIFSVKIYFTSFFIEVTTEVIEYEEYTFVHDFCIPFFCVEFIY
jgi:hypothetical protein